MILRYGYFWNPGVMKRKTIVLPTSTVDLRANSIVGFSKGKPTKKSISEIYEHNINLIFRILPDIIIVINIIQEQFPISRFPGLEPLRLKEKFVL